MGGVGVRRRPSDKEEKALAGDTGTAGGIHGDFAVHDLIHEIGIISIHIVTGIADGLIGDRPGWELILGIGGPREKTRNMEHRVKRHGGGEGEFVGYRGDHFGDSEWSKVPGAEFGGGIVGEGNIVGGKADTVANIEGEVTAVAVGLLGLLSLSKFQLTGDGGVNIPECVKVFGGGGISGGGIGGDEGGRDSGVESKVGIKWSLLGGGADGVVVGKFGDGEPGGPIIMERVDEGTEDLLDTSVSNLRLSISLRVVGCGHIELRAKGCKKGLPEGGGDARVAVGDNDMRKALFGENIVNEQVSQLRRGQSFIGSDKYGLLGEHAHKCNNGIIGSSIMGNGGGKVGNEISGNVRPRTGRDGVGLKEARGGLSGGFGALSSGTRAAVAADGSCHARPPEMGGDGVQSFEKSMMTSSWGVMKFIEETLAKGRVVRNTNAIPEIPNIIAQLQVRRSFAVVFRVEGIVGIRRFDIIQNGVGEGHVGREQLAELIKQEC